MEAKDSGAVLQKAHEAGVTCHPDENTTGKYDNGMMAVVCQSIANEEAAAEPSVRRRKAGKSSPLGPLLQLSSAVVGRMRRNRSATPANHVGEQVDGPVRKRSDVRM